MGDASAALARTAARYRATDRFSRHYVAAKLRRDPVYAALLALATEAPLGEVLDLGCGRGQVALALLEAGLASAVQGFDWPGEALTAAARAGTGLPFRAVPADLATLAVLPAADTVLFIDVLYQIEESAQARLLALAAAAARRRVLVRTLDPGHGARSSFTLALELLGRRFWPNTGETVRPVPPRAIAAQLEAAGFTVTISPCWRGTPFANVLLDARRE